MRQCPKVITTRWIYLHHIFEFIKDNLECVNAPLSIYEMPLILGDYRLLYEPSTRFHFSPIPWTFVPEPSAKCFQVFKKCFGNGEFSQEKTKDLYLLRNS
jgi:hypothetical protein